MAAKALAPIKVLNCGVQCGAKTADAACITVALPEVKIVSGTNVDPKWMLQQLLIVTQTLTHLYKSTTNTRTHARTHARSHTHTLSLSLSHTHTHSLTRTHPHTHAHTHTHTRESDRRNAVVGRSCHQDREANARHCRRGPRRGRWRDPIKSFGCCSLWHMVERQRDLANHQQCV